MRTTSDRSRSVLRATALLCIGLLAGVAAGMEWILTRPAGPPPPSGASTSSARARGAYLIVGVTRIVADRVLGDSIRGAHLIAFTRWALDALRPGTCPRPTATP